MKTEFSFLFQAMRLHVDAKDFHFTLRRRRSSSGSARDGKERLVGIFVIVRDGTNGMCLVAADDSLQGGGGGGGHYYV